MGRVAGLRARLGLEFSWSQQAGPDLTGHGPGLKISARGRPVVENNRKSITKEEIEIFCFYLFNVIKVQNTQQA